MKVIAVFHGYIGGPVPLRAGAEMAAHALLSHVVARGHEVDVVCTPGQHAPLRGYEVDGVRVLAGRLTQHAVWQGEYDVLMTHLNASSTALHAADRAFSGMPTVLLLHNDHGETLQTMTSHLGFRRKRLVVANSEWIARAATRAVNRSLVGRTVEVMTVHPHVPCETYRTSVFPTRTVTLVNTTESKGGRLFADLARRMPDVHFLAVTGAYGKQETGSYRTLPNVTVLPTTSDMRRVYMQTDVLMMGGWYESWGRVGVEAACSGIPVVSTPMPGPLEALGDSAVFVDAADLPGWERAIRSLLDDTVEYGRRSALCRARAEELEALAVQQRDMFVTALEKIT